MSASNIQITQGSGTRLATNSYTEGGVTVHDEKMILGFPYLPTYTVTTAAISTGTANSHLLQIMAGSSLHVYITRIKLYQFGLATTAAMSRIALYRLSTAGTGGTSRTPGALDTTDGAAGATAMELPSAKGTEGSASMWASVGQFIQTVPTGGVGQATLLLDYDSDEPKVKMLRIPAGTANGIAVKLIDAIAGATVQINLEFIEASF